MAKWVCCVWSCIIEKNGLFEKFCNVVWRSQDAYLKTGVNISPNLCMHPANISLWIYFVVLPIRCWNMITQWIFFPWSCFVYNWPSHPQFLYYMPACMGHMHLNCQPVVCLYNDTQDFMPLWFHTKWGWNFLTNTCIIRGNKIGSR